jgi:tetratricopeptide (TPR) repeat protein
VGKVIDFGVNENIVDMQRKYINESFNKKDYGECISHCDFLLNLLPKDEKSRKTVRALCLRKQADCLGRLKKFKEAFEKIVEAKIDCGKDDYYKAVYVEALTYKAMGDKANALRCLDEVIEWYERNEMYYELAKALDVKAEIYKYEESLKSEELFREAIRNYGLAEKETDWKYINKDKFYIEFDNVYYRLVELLIHMNNENQIKLYAALSHIKNSNIKAEVEQKIKDSLGKEV